MTNKTVRYLNFYQIIGAKNYRINTVSPDSPFRIILYSKDFFFFSRTLSRFMSVLQAFEWPQ